MRNWYVLESVPFPFGESSLMLTCRISTYVHMVISSTQKRSVVWLRLVRTAAPATLPRLLSEQPNMKPPAIQQKKSPLRWTHKWTSHSKRCFSEVAIKRSRLLSQTASSSTRSKSAWILNRVTAKKIRTSHGHTNLTAASRQGRGAFEVNLVVVWNFLLLTNLKVLLHNNFQEHKLLSTSNSVTHWESGRTAIRRLPQCPTDNKSPISKLFGEPRHHPVPLNRS